jgi:hypothetical protein
MSNVLGPYDEVFYAAEALIWLTKQLGIGSRVYRALDSTPNQIGSTITVRRPTTFTATSMPASASDLVPDSVSVTLSNWKGVVFALTDKELAYSRQRLIDEHIGPAANAVADAIDTSLWALYTHIPWTVAATSDLAVNDIVDVRKQLAVNKVPMNDGRLHLGLSPTLEAEALQLSAFSQSQGAGAMAEATQRTGSLGMKFGFEVFMSQNTPTHTHGTCADFTGALVGDHAKGATTVIFDAVTAAGDAAAGDYFVIAGDTQRYAITAAAVATGGGEITVYIDPPLKAAALDNAVVTGTLAASTEQSMGFHRDAFALAMGVLPETGNQLGARIANVQDAASGLAIRSRLWYDGTNAKVYCGLDALWGVACLNPNLACRLTD